MPRSKNNPKRVIFAEGEEEVVLRAAIQFRDFGYGTPVLVGRTQAVRDKLAELGVDDPGAFEIQNSADSALVPQMVDYLYERLQRRGYTERDVRRMVNQDRNTFASLLLALGHGDAMISGLTRTFAQTMREVSRVLDPKPGAGAVRHPPDDRQELHRVPRRHDDQRAAERRASWRISPSETAAVARRLGHEPRVAFLSLFDLRQSAGQVAREHPRRGRTCSTPRSRASSTRARWRPTPRSTRG